MITIIAAVARNRAIGYKNKLIYWLPNDLKRFKSLGNQYSNLFLYPKALFLATAAIMFIIPFHIGH